MNPFDDIIDEDDSSDSDDSGDDGGNELLVSYRKLLQENRQIKGDMSRLYKICNDSQDMHQDEVENSVKLNRALSDTRMQCDSLEQKYYLLKAKFETLEKKHATQRRRASDISEQLLLKLKLDSETTIRELQSQVRTLKKDLAMSKTQLEKAEASLSSHEAQSRRTASKSVSTNTTMSMTSSSNIQNSTPSSSSSNHLTVSPIISLTPSASSSANSTNSSRALGPVSPLFIARSSSNSKSDSAASEKPFVPSSPGIPKIPGIFQDSPRLVDRATGTSSDDVNLDNQIVKSGVKFSKISDYDDRVSTKQRTKTAGNDDSGHRKTIAELRAKVDSLTKDLSESRSKLNVEIENRKKEEARASKLADEVIFLQGQMCRASSNSAYSDDKATQLTPVNLNSYPINEPSSSSGDSERDNAPLLSPKRNERGFLSRICSIL